jgi:uncharacterized membrane protein YhaH (DUF805 family)
MRAVWLVVGSAIFVASAVFLWGPGDSSAARVLSIGFFSFCGAAGLGMLIAPPRLEIGPSGLAQSVLWTTRRFAWTDVHGFRPTTVGLATRTVGFDYLTAPPKGAGLRGLNAALAGVQGSLQPGWEIDPQTLADLLNKARERWLEVAGNAQQISSAPPSRRPFSVGFASARFSRKTYWLATGAVFAMAFALAYIPGIQRGLGTLTSLIFVRIFASRLHDFGRSGWWQVILYGIQMPVILLTAMVGGQPIGVAVGFGLLIELIFIVVLGAIRGDRGPNRFGPTPSQPSPIAMSEPSR